MYAAAEVHRMMDRQTQQAAAEIARHRHHLRNFVRGRIANEADVDDIVQDVFAELIEACRLMEPIEHVSAWLFRVARNRITDLFRKHKADAFSELSRADDDETMLDIETLLTSDIAGPDTDYAHSVLLDELDLALSELPPEQQDIFIAHEIEGRSFKELAAETGLSVNTLLARKHYAVRHLRKRLQAIYDEFN